MLVKGHLFAFAMCFSAEQPVETCIPVAGWPYPTDAKCIEEMWRYISMYEGWSRVVKGQKCMPILYEDKAPDKQQR